MILDERTEFADAEDISAAAGTALIGDVIDLGANTQFPGVGEPMYLVIQITTAVSGTSSTVNFRLRSDGVAAIHATTSTAHWESGAIAEATLVAGYTMVVALPRGSTVYERYLGIQAVTAVATTNAGAINAFLTHDVAEWTSYADAAN